MGRGAGSPNPLNNSPTFWMNLQTRSALEVAEDEIAAKVARDVQPLAENSRLKTKLPTWGP